MFDRTTSGSAIKYLSTVDEHWPECLALKTARSITPNDVIDMLAEPSAMRGVPRHVRNDNELEFIARAIQDWLKPKSVETLYFE